MPISGGVGLYVNPDKCGKSKVVNQDPYCLQRAVMDIYKGESDLIRREACAEGKR